MFFTITEPNITPPLLELELLGVPVLRRVDDSATAVAHREVAVPVIDEVLAPRLVFLLEAVLALVLDEEEGEEDANEAAARGDDEGVAFAELVCDVRSETGAEKEGRGGDVGRERTAAEREDDFNAGRGTVTRGKWGSCGRKRWSTHSGSG